MAELNTNTLMGSQAQATGYPKFHESGNITADGQKLLEFVVAQFEEADKKNDLGRLNSLHGPIAEYYANVYKMHTLSPLSWLERFGQSARNAYDIMKYVEAQVLKETQQTATIENTADRTKALEDNLKKLSESVEEVQQKLQDEINALRAENEALKAKKPVGRPAKAAATEETPAETGSTEEKPTPDTETPAE